MRWPPLIVVLLIVAAVLLNACAWVALEGKTETGPARILLLALAVSQINLVAAWAVLGPGKWWSRVSVLAAVAAALAWLVQAGRPAPKDRLPTFLAFEFEAILVAAGLALVRLSGQRLRHSPAGDPISPQRDQPNS